TEGDVTIENPGSPATTATLHNDNSTITANFKSGAELVFTVRASANKIVPMPVLGSGPYIIDYGDGTVAQEVDLRAPGYTQYPGSYHTYSADGEYTVTIKGPAATAFSFRGTRNSDLQYTNPCPAKSILKNTIDISCVTSLENAFSGMKSLESIECDLFESCKGRVTTCANIFDQCTNLHTIYNGLFEGFDKCTDFSLAFHYTALNSIPANTFRGCSSAVKFNSTFSAIPNILSIPAGLFDDCVNAKEFASTFELLNISTVPERLFAKCVKATFFRGTFRQSHVTTVPGNVFENCRAIENVSSCFENCSWITSLPEMWNTSLYPKIKTYNAFAKNCNKASNYSAVPAAWK
ncbi:hypothetical protein AABJ39_23295, partial [Bacteroides fragilis]